MEVTKNIEIKDGIVRIDGTVDFCNTEKTFKIFSEQIYKHYQIDYVKRHDQRRRKPGQSKSNQKLRVNL